MENEKTITIEIPKGYRFKGRTFDKFVFEKMNDRPTEIREASEILGIGMFDHERYRNRLLETLRELLLFRDAWWKMADDWKPDWTNFKVNKFCIGVDRNITSSCNKVTGNKILAFPTAEMRDAFHDNFKEQIEICKELL